MVHSPPTKLECQVSKHSQAYFLAYHYIKVHKFLCEAGHVVFKAECILSDVIGGEYVIALPFSSTVQDNDIPRVLYIKINIEGATGLDL